MEDKKALSLPMRIIIILRKNFVSEMYLKEKSGTIWILVLVYAMLDYMVVLNY